MFGKDTTENSSTPCGTHNNGQGEAADGGAIDVAQLSRSAGESHQNLRDTATQTPRWTTAYIDTMPTHRIVGRKAGMVQRVVRGAHENHIEMLVSQAINRGDDGVGVRDGE